MADLKKIDEATMIDRLDKVALQGAEYARLEIDQARARAIVEVREAAAALRDMPATASDLLTAAAKVFVTEAEIQYREDTRIQLNIGAYGLDVVRGYFSGNEMVLNGRYRILLAFLPLDEKKQAP